MKWKRLAALSRAARHAGVIDSSGTNGGAPSTQLNIIGGRKTNREAHVGQMDEGRSAGAVCRRDKSTLGARGGREAEEPGVEPSVTDTHWPAQAWRCLHTVASNVCLRYNGFKSTSCYCTTGHATKPLDLFHMFSRDRAHGEQS